MSQLADLVDGTDTYTGAGAVYAFTAPVGNPLQDTLTFAAGAGITLTTNATTDTVTITGSTAGLDSAGATALIDSSYVSARAFLSIDSDLTTTDSAQIIHSFSKTTYSTVKYIAQLKVASGYHAEELLLTHNGTNIAITSYAKLLLDSDLGIFDAQITGSNVELTLNPTKANTNVKLKAIPTAI
jgi:hypothetical protein